MFVSRPATGVLTVDLRPTIELRVAQQQQKKKAERKSHVADLSGERGRKDTVTQAHRVVGVGRVKRGEASQLGVGHRRKGQGGEDRRNQVRSQTEELQDPQPRVDRRHRSGK